MFLVGSIFYITSNNSVSGNFTLKNRVMTKEVKVSFYLKRNETKKDGKSPVMARLSIGKFSETIFSAKMTVPADL